MAVGNKKKKKSSWRTTFVETLPPGVERFHEKNG